MNEAIIKYPEGFTVQQEGLPDYAVLLSSNSANFDKDKEIYVAYKDSSVKLNGTSTSLDPDSFIHREAAGVEEVVDVEEVRIGQNTVKKVVRRAAETNQNVLIYYIFRGSKVLRVSLFPHIQQDSIEAVKFVEDVIANLSFANQ